MSSSNDKSLPQGAELSSSKSLVPYRAGPEAGASTASARGAGPAAELRRWALPALLLALTGSVGWYAGAHSASPISGPDRFQAQASISEDIKAQAAVIASLEARLKHIETTPGAEATLKPGIEILAQRIDEIARRQTLALTQTSTRLDRTDKDIGTRMDRLAERMERVEKQVSSPAPVSAIPKNTTAVTRHAPESAAGPAPKAVPKVEAADVEKAVRGYVLREVFRGGALVESRYGVMEVFPGAQLPGAGRVRSVEKRDGRWVVVTTAGLIEAQD
jgi:hypothetical protein